jgi:hypothetical protein
MIIGKGIIKKVRVNSFEIVPFNDSHYGSELCNEPLVKKTISYIKCKPNCFTYLGGDLIEAAIYGTIGSVHQQRHQIDEQVHDIVKMLRPIRDKIIFGVCGNHEYRVEKSTGLNIMKIICEQLDVPYMGWESYFGIKVKHGTICKCYAHHGVGAGSTAGSKLNSLEKLHFRAPLSNLIMCGHIHTPLNSEKEVRYLDQNGNVCSHIQHFVSTGSSHLSDGYAAMKALGPIRTSATKIKVKHISNKDFVVEIEKIY